MTQDYIPWGIFCLETGVIKFVEDHAVGKGPTISAEWGCKRLQPNDDPKTMKVNLDDPYGPLLPYEPPVDATKLRRRAIARVNAVANRLSSALRTDGEHMAALYPKKEAQARAWLSDSALAPDAVPLVRDEAAALGVTLDEAATLIVQKADYVRNQEAAIERVRRNTVIRLRAADHTEIDAIENEAAWPAKETA